MVPPIPMLSQEWCRKQAGHRPTKGGRIFFFFGRSSEQMFAPSTLAYRPRLLAAPLQAPQQESARPRKRCEVEHALFQAGWPGATIFLCLLMMVRVVYKWCIAVMFPLDRDPQSFTDLSLQLRLIQRPNIRIPWPTRWRTVGVARWTKGWASTLPQCLFIGPLTRKTHYLRMHRNKKSRLGVEPAQPHINARLAQANLTQLIFCPNVYAARQIWSGLVYPPHLHPTSAISCC